MALRCDIDNEKFKLIVNLEKIFQNYDLDHEKFQKSGLEEAM